MDADQELEGESSFARFKYPFSTAPSLCPPVGNCLNVFGHLHYVRFGELIRPCVHIRTYTL